MEYVRYSVEPIERFTDVPLGKTLVVVVKQNLSAFFEAQLEMISQAYASYVNISFEKPDGLLSSKYKQLRVPGTYMLSNKGFFYSELTDPLEIVSLIDYIKDVDNGQ